MSRADSDHETLFFRNFELYEKAKLRGEDASRFAVIALAQIHHKSGVSAAEDRDANVRAMHEWSGPLFTEAQIRGMYDQLRKDAGLE